MTDCLPDDVYALAYLAHGKIVFRALGDSLFVVESKLTLVVRVPCASPASGAVITTSQGCSNRRRDGLGDSNRL